MDKEQIASGIDFLKSHKDRFMEDGTEIVPDQEAAGNALPSGFDNPSKGAPASEAALPNAPGGHMKAFEAAAKKAIVPAVTANLPKEMPEKAHEAVLEALKEKQAPTAAPQPEVKMPNHAKKEEPKEQVAEKAP